MKKQDICYNRRIEWKLLEVCCISVLHELLPRKYLNSALFLSLYLSEVAHALSAVLWEHRRATTRSKPQSGRVS